MLGLRFRRVLGGWARIVDIKGPNGEPMRALKVGGAYQSLVHLGERANEPAVSYYKAFDCAFQQFDDDGSPSAVRDVLLIGGGACAYPRHLLASNEDVRIDVVERDPKIIKIARKLFGVDELLEEHAGRLRLIQDDGLHFLEANDREYDAIMFDAYNGESPVMDLLEGKGLESVKRSLREGGSYLANIVVEDAKELERYKAGLRQAFEDVSAIAAIDEELSDSENYMLICR